MTSSGHKGTEIVEICRADNVGPANRFAGVDRRNEGDVARGAANEIDDSVCPEL